MTCAVAAGFMTDMTNSILWLWEVPETPFRSMWTPWPMSSSAAMSSAG